MKTAQLINFYLFLVTKQFKSNRNDKLFILITYKALTARISVVLHLVSRFKVTSNVF